MNQESSSSQIETKDFQQNFKLDPESTQEINKQELCLDVMNNCEQDDEDYF